MPPLPSLLSHAVCLLVIPCRLAHMQKTQLAGLACNWVAQFEGHGTDTCMAFARH